jgi:hypothetical protein
MTHETFETTSFSIDLTGAEISTILYYLEWKVWELNKVGLEEDIAPEIERIFAQLQSAADSYYAQPIGDL